MGVREKMSIENWDPVRTFAICLNPLEPEEVQDASLRQTYTKAVGRIYELVDLLHVNKSNLAFNSEIQPIIRKRMQGYMINMTNSTMEVLKRSNQSRQSSQSDTRET